MNEKSKRVRCGAALLLLTLTGSVGTVSAPASAQAPAGHLSAVATHPMAELRALLDRAVATHAREVVIPPGVYRGGPDKSANGGAIVTLRGAANLRIVARGVEMVCTMRTRALEFDDCHDVEVDGLAIDYDPLTFTQGTVTAVAADKSSIDVTLDAGYPRQPFSRVDVVDPKTRFRKHGMLFLWGTKAAMVQPDVVRVTLKGIGDAAPFGSLASLNEGNEAGGICHGVTLEHCGGGMVLRDWTIYCAPGMGIVEHAGAGGTHLVGLQIVPGPPPPGATAPRLLTTSWDGVLHTEVRHGPTVENCTIVKCGDDSWSVQSDPLLAVASTADGAVLAGSIDLQPGDHLRTSLDAPPWTVRASRRVPIAQANLDTATLDKLKNAPQYTLWSVGHDTVQLVTFEPGPTSLPPPSAGTSVFSPENQGNGFVFRNNRTYSSGRVLIKAGDGLIEGNTLREAHNLVVIPEVPKGGAYGIAHLVFRRNHLIGADCFNAMPWSVQAGGLCVAGLADAPPGAIRDVRVEDNVFENIDAANVWMTGVQNVTLTGNRFLRPDNIGPLSTSGADFGVHPSSVVQLRRCNAVRLTGNTLIAPGPLEKLALDTDLTVTGLTGSESGGIIVTVAAKGAK